MNYDPTTYYVIALIPEWAANGSLNSVDIKAGSYAQALRDRLAMLAGESRAMIDGRQFAVVDARSGRSRLFTATLPTPIPPIVITEVT